MYSGIGCSSFSSTARNPNTIDQEQFHGRSQSHAAMDIDSSGGQPPSFGDVRQIFVSEPSGSDQMYSDGQPPSLNDVGKREPSQSEASCTRYEGPDSHEVQQPRISEIGGEKNQMINPEIWQACAGPLVNLPAAGTHVVYFAQGHCQQVAKSKRKDVDAQIPNYPNLPSKLLCILHNVTLHANTETDEVYAEMNLQPVPWFNKNTLSRSNLLIKAEKPQMEIFCTTLTKTDVNINQWFFVPDPVTEKIFPPLDYSMQQPAQELVARDLHNNVWIFRHIYHGQLKCHLLTTGWSSFVSEKRLLAGDSVLFIRDEKQQLLLGIRRANRQPVNLSTSLLSNDNIHIRILATASQAAINYSPFTVFYNPRATPLEFVIPLAKYHQAVYSSQISIGMRFQMTFEAEALETRTYMGTVIGISDLDDVRWKNSEWCNLKVEWDKTIAGERRKHVSIWEIKPVVPFFITPPKQGVLAKESNPTELL